jgi:hypothetical protein
VSICLEIAQNRGKQKMRFLVALACALLACLLAYGINAMAAVGPTTNRGSAGTYRSNATFVRLSTGGGWVIALANRPGTENARLRRIV